RLCRWAEGDDAAAQWAGERFHVCGQAEGRGGAALDVVLSAGQSERGVFGGADVEGGGDVFDGACAVQHRADAADERDGGGGAAVAGGWEEAGDAPVGGAVRGAAGIAVLAELTWRTKGSGVFGAGSRQPPQLCCRQRLPTPWAG